MAPKKPFHITSENSAKYISKYAGTGPLRPSSKLFRLQQCQFHVPTLSLSLSLIDSNYYAIYFKVCLRNKFRISALISLSLVATMLLMVASMLASFAFYFIVLMI